MRNVLPLSPLRVMVVDDEDSLLRFAGRVLRRAGYLPVLETSGASAIQRLDFIDRLDVLVTDLIMPPMNGDELARRMRERHPDLKVLYVTGSSAALFDRMKRLGNDEALLEKPYTISELSEAIALLASSP